MWTRHDQASGSGADTSQEFDITSPLVSAGTDIVTVEEQREFGGNSRHLSTPCAKLGRRLRYYVPVLQWLPKYQWANNFPSDLLAGITISFMLVPQGLSYASSLANLHPIYGLYCAFVPVIMYALFGTSRQMSIGPSALIMLLVGSTIAKVQTELQIHEGNYARNGSDEFTVGVPVEPAVIASSLCLLVGFFTFVLGIFRFGFLDSVLSRALLRGFVTAIAFVIMIEQSATLLGIQLPRSDNSSPLSHYYSRGSSTSGFGSLSLAVITNLGYTAEAALTLPLSPVEKLFRVLHLLDHTHIYTLLLSICSISFLIIVARLKIWLTPRYSGMRFIPEILLLVIITTWLSYKFDFEKYDIPVLGTVKVQGYGFPKPFIPFLAVPSRMQAAHMIRALTMPAVLISILGFVESVAAAKQYASKYNYNLSRNRELVALGVCNIMGSFFHAVPAYGSLARSRVNDRMGARTQMAGFIAGCIILCTILFLLPLFSYLPRAAMASIILIASFSLIELDDLRFIYRIHAWRDLALLCFTCLTTLFVSIEAGTLLSIALSLFLVVKHTTVLQMTVLGKVRDTDNHFCPIHDYPEDEIEQVDRTLIVKIEESLHFSNASELRQRLNRVEQYGDLRVHPSEHARWPADAINHVVFEMSGVLSVDATALQTLLEALRNYRQRHVDISFVKLRPSLQSMFDQAGITECIGPGRFFRHISDAVIDHQHLSTPHNLTADARGSVNSGGSSDGRENHTTSVVLNIDRTQCHLPV